MFNVSYSSSVLGVIIGSHPNLHGLFFLKLKGKANQYSPKGKDATGSGSQKVEETDPQLNHHHHPTENEGT